MNNSIGKILQLMDTRIEILERSNPNGATEKFLRKDFNNLITVINFEFDIINTQLDETLKLQEKDKNGL